MTVLKTLKDGKVALVFEAEQVAVAAQIFSMVVGGSIPKLSIDTKRTLADVATAVTSSGVSMRLNTPVAVTETVKGLSPEKIANDICSLLLEKQIPVFGTTNTARLRPFYSEVEQYFKAPIAETYRKISAGISNKAHYPNRKIDLIVRMVDADELYELAKKYEYKTA